MLTCIKQLLEQKDQIENQLIKEINKIKINTLDDKSLVEFFNTVSDSFTSYDLYTDSYLDNLLSEIGLTYHDTFNLDRYQTMDYSDVISRAFEWDENYEYTSESCKLLKKWANTSELEEAKNKFQLAVIKIALNSRNRGFTYDW